MSFEKNYRHAQSLSVRVEDTNPFRNTNYNCYPSNYVPNHYYHHGSNSNYLNCAAPKSVLTHNCQMIRQIQRDFPPYPTDVGVYYVNAQTQSNPYYNAPYQTTPPCSSPQRSVMPMAAASRPNALDLNFEPKNSVAKVKGPKHPGILKNYKSCPVSPVHEEIDWITIDESRQLAKECAHRNERHSMYGEDAKTILSMIHTDTEKMIAEITQKYGDLDMDMQRPQANAISTAAASGDDGMQEEEDGSFSSDSLEDCSLDLDCNIRCQTNSRTRKSVCKKKHRKNETISMMPTRSVSDYFIYDEFYLNRNRNVSLSDILNDDADKPKPNYAFLSSQRHSSASFFLAPERKSQESLISDDMSGCGVSYCNSMESILSDESECKSAPLEALFTKTKRDIMYRTPNTYDARFEAQVTTSKSYGSSPNNNVFDYYMDQQYGYGFQDRDGCNVANYDYDCLMSNNTSARTSSRCSPLPPPPEFQNITKSFTIPNSCTFPSLSTVSYQQRNDDYIPRFGSKNDQYSTQTNKSLSKEFATERQIKNSNPLYGCDDDSDFFERKPVKPAVPAKPSNLMTPIETIKPLPSTSTAISTPTTDDSNKIKRSCSFEIEMFHSRGRALQQKSAAKKYEQNLQKFEKDRHRMRNGNAQMGGTLEMPYVPHKPPVANRRSASMRAKRGGSIKVKDKSKIEERMPPKSFEKGRLGTPKQKQSLKELECCEMKETDERTIEIYIAEKGVCEDDNMDSLDLYTKPNLYKENSMDSLDEIPKSRAKQPAARSVSIDAHESARSLVTSEFLSQVEYMKFRDIEKKIDVINKLVELEEKKLEQERFEKERRMRPFDCNSNEKGYVKSLTVNFDNLAKSIKFERELSLRLRERADIRRNHSLPDVLEDTKYRFDYDFKQRRQRSTENYLDGYGVEGVRLERQFPYSLCPKMFLFCFHFGIEFLVRSN